LQTSPFYSQAVIMIVSTQVVYKMIVT
jgi:hypothetical protein